MSLLTTSLHSKSFISIKMRERLNNIIVKDIKGILLLRPKLLKPKVSNKSLLKIKKFTLI